MVTHEFHLILIFLKSIEIFQQLSLIVFFSNSSLVFSKSTNLFQNHEQHVLNRQISAKLNDLNQVSVYTRLFKMLLPICKTFYFTMEYWAFTYTPTFLINLGLVYPPATRLLMCNFVKLKTILFLYPILKTSTEKFVCTVSVVI